MAILWNLIRTTTMVTKRTSMLRYTYVASLVTCQSQREWK